MIYEVFVTTDYEINTTALTLTNSKANQRFYRTFSLKKIRPTLRHRQAGGDGFECRRSL